MKVTLELKVRKPDKVVLPEDAKLTYMGGGRYMMVVPIQKVQITGTIKV